MYVGSCLMGGNIEKIENITLTQYLIANDPQLFANALQIGAVIGISMLNGGKKLI